jgi:predicted Zn-ribbon and HTH transcriptional regulator
MALNQRWQRMRTPKCRNCGQNNWRTDIVRVRGSTPLSVPAQCNACGLKVTLWDRVQLWTDYRR